MSKNNDHLKNPLVGKDPVSQYLLFKNNIKELKRNIDIIVKLAKPLISYGLTNGCEISKAISNKICLGTSILGTQVKSFDLNTNAMYKNLQKAAVEVQNAAAQVQNNVATQVQNTAAQVQNTAAQVQNNITKQVQSGGYKNNYNYIKNPLTNRYISIHSKKGIKLLKNYIDLVI